MSKKKSNLLETDGKLSLRLTTLIVIALALVLVTLFYCNIRLNPMERR